MYKIKSGLLCVILTAFIISCSSSETLTDSEAEAEFPQWYEPAGFSTDSVYFSSYGSAISSDSVKAISRADKEARAKLENFIAEKLENARYHLEEKGSSFALDADFILTLRNAHAPVEEQAELVEGVARKSDNYYRGFAKASITRNALKKLLEAGFSGKATYWTELQESNIFTEELK